MTTQKIYIEYQMETLTTFGSRIDNGERVFINSKLVKKYNIQEEEIRELVILPNSSSSHETPWRAVGVSVADASGLRDVDVSVTPRVEEAKLEDRIVDFFDTEGNNFPHSAPSIADALGVDDLQMQHTLGRMHTTGEIAKAQVFARGTQDKASVVLWAPEVSWFSA